MVVAGAKVAAIRVNTSTQAFHGDGKTNALRVCLAGRKKTSATKHGLFREITTGTFSPLLFYSVYEQPSFIGRNDGIADALSPRNSIESTTT